MGTVWCGCLCVLCMGVCTYGCMHLSIGLCVGVCVCVCVCVCCVWVCASFYRTVAVCVLYGHCVCVTVCVQDVDKCVAVLEDLDELPVNYVMLRKNPDIMKTIKQVCTELPSSPLSNNPPPPPNPHSQTPHWGWEWTAKIKNPCKLAYYSLRWGGGGCCLFLFSPSLFESH